jgi:hypothetical protein
LLVSEPRNNRQNLFNFFKINIFTYFGRVRVGSIAGICPGMLTGGIRLAGGLPGSLTIHLLKLLANMTGGPENRKNETHDKAVKQIKENS